MGRKSISNRIPKKSRPFSNVDIRGLVRGRFVEHTHVHPPLKDVDISLIKDRSQPSNESDKTQAKP